MVDTTQQIMNFENSNLFPLILKAFLALLFGLVLWRIFAQVLSKSSQPKQSNYFKSKYSDKWRKKRP